MKKNVIVGLVLGCVLGVAAAVRAQNAESHKVTGTLSTVQGEHLMVKTEDGRSVMVMLDAKTAITRDKKKVDAKSLKTGDRVVAEGPGDNNMIMAKTVEVGAPAKPAKK